MPVARVAVCIVRLATAVGVIGGLSLRSCITRLRSARLCVTRLRVMRLRSARLRRTLPRLTRLRAPRTLLLRHRAFARYGRRAAAAIVLRR